MKYLVFLMLVLPMPCFATSYQPLGEYRAMWCSKNGGKVEYVNGDDTGNFVCIKDQYAINIEYAGKWREAVGQALYYSIITGKKPGIALIVSDSTDDISYLKNLNLVARKYNIRVWDIR